MSRAKRCVLLGALLASAGAGAPAYAFAAEQRGLPARAVEEGPGRSGLRLALRSGFAVPLGQAFQGSGALQETMTGHVPLRLDIGYRLGPHVYFGAVGQLGVLLPKRCPAGERCSGTNARIGVMAAYHLAPARTIDPWVGLGTGIEILSVSRSSGPANLDVTARGLELIDVELGADVRASRSLRLGPVLSTSLCRYTSVTVNDSATADFDRTLHAWVMLGLRGAFDL